MFSFFRNLLSRRSRRIVPDLVGEEEEERTATTSAMETEDGKNGPPPPKVGCPCWQKVASDLRSLRSAFLGSEVREVAMTDAQRFDDKRRGSPEKPVVTVEYATAFSDDTPSPRSCLKNAVPEAVTAEAGGAKAVDPKKDLGKKSRRRRLSWGKNSPREVPARPARPTVRPHAPAPESEDEREASCCPWLFPTEREIAQMCETQRTTRRERMRARMRDRWRERRRR